MARPKPRVTCDRRTGRWTVSRPTLGFTGHELRSFSTWREAMEWLSDDVTRRQGVSAGQLERSATPTPVAWPYQRMMHVVAESLT